MFDLHIRILKLLAVALTFISKRIGLASHQQGRR